jgi:hypothetical protein
MQTHSHLCPQEPSGPSNLFTVMCMAQSRSPLTEFEVFYIDHGIQRQHTVRNRPQQNGVADRANRTIEEGIISMFHESGMPHSFWSEAISFFIHVSNKVTTASLQGATPHEAFYGNKPNLSHLHVWGCKEGVTRNRQALCKPILPVQLLCFSTSTTQKRPILVPRTDTYNAPLQLLCSRI